MQQSIEYHGKTIILFSPTEKHYCADVYANGAREHCGRGWKTIADAMSEAIDHIDKSAAAPTIALDSAADIILPQCAPEIARVGLAIGLALAIVAAGGLAFGAPATPPKNGGTKFTDPTVDAMKKALADKALADRWNKAFPAPRQSPWAAPFPTATASPPVPPTAIVPTDRPIAPPIALARPDPLPVYINPSTGSAVRHDGRFDSATGKPVWTGTGWRFP